MAKSPAFQFYANDWLSSMAINLMTPAEEGAYIRLLAYAWASDDCGLPDDDEVLARLSRLGEGWFKGGSTTLRKCFKPIGNRLYNERLLEEREKQIQWREKSSRGGQKSVESRKSNKNANNNEGWLENGSKGGSKMVGTKDEPKANSSSSSSSSICTPPNPPNEGIECDEKKSIDPTSRKAMILDAQAEHGVKPLRDDANHTEFILTKWNMLAHRDLPKCKTWTMAHHRAVLALAEEHGGLEAFTDLFEEAINGHINQSDFLLGKSESKFRCTLNWILGMTKNKDAFDNVISGAYDGAEREDEKPAAQEDDDWNTPLRQDQYVIDDRPFWEREKNQK